jgi:hypothetical protein
MLAMNAHGAAMLTCEAEFERAAPDIRINERGVRFVMH